MVRSDHSLKILTRFGRVVASLAAVAWFGYLGLQLQYAFTRPTSMQPGLGRLYALETHGSVVYLTHNEVFLLHTLGETAGGLVVAVIVLGLIIKRRERGK